MNIESFEANRFADPTAVIHIGFHKTGTTWLQEDFLPLLRNVHLVPRHSIVRAFLQPHALEFDPSRALAELAPVSGSRLVMSMEALSGYPLNAGLHGALSRDMVRRLQLCFPNAHIVAFVRRQPDALVASWAQHVRHGGTFSLACYLGLRGRASGTRWRPDKRPLFDLTHYAYLPLLRLYREAFGPDRVHVYLYEELRASPDTLLSRFCEDTGLEPVPRDSTTRSARQSRRRSYAPWLVQLARLLNRFSDRDVAEKSCWLPLPGGYPLARGVCECLARVFPPRSSAKIDQILGQSLADRVRDHYRDSNRALAEEFNLPLERFAYPMPIQPRRASEANTARENSLNEFIEC